LVCSGHFRDQQHTLFAVTDFKLSVFSVNFGLGYGLTPASDRFVVKTIMGYALLRPGEVQLPASVLAPLDLSIQCRDPLRG
jgi:hypothetical protein